MNEKLFKAIKNAYALSREEERLQIKEHLAQNGFTVKSGSEGKGKSDYTACGKINPPYDLSNWKYVEAEKDNKCCIVSLQPYSESCGGHVVLMDRIGIYVDERYDKQRAFTNMEVTDMELPMDEDKLDRLVTLLNERV